MLPYINIITSTKIRFNTTFPLSRTLSIRYSCIDIRGISYITQNNVRFYTNIVSAIKPDAILHAEILDILYRKRH